MKHRCTHWGIKRLSAALVSVLLSVGAHAQSATAALPQGGDPRLPDSMKTMVPQASPRGAALNQLVQRKLRANFDSVDVTRSGRVTREQARSGRWSVLAEHFDEIDAARRGEVSFDEVMRYLERTRTARDKSR